MSRVLEGARGPGLLPGRVFGLIVIAYPAAEPGEALRISRTAVARAVVGPSGMKIARRRNSNSGDGHPLPPIGGVFPVSRGTPGAMSFGIVLKYVASA